MKKRKPYFILITVLLLCIFVIGCGKKTSSKTVTNNLTKQAVKQQDTTTPGWKNKNAVVLTSPSFQLQNITYTLPCSYKSFKNEHLHMKKSDETTTVNANDFFSGAIYDDSDQIIAYLYLTNKHNTPQKAADCSVTGISISPYEKGFSKNISFLLEDTVSFKSTSDDAISSIGKPGDAFQSEGDIVCLTWYGANYKKNYYDSLTLTYEKEKLTSICLFFQGK